MADRVHICGKALSHRVALVALACAIALSTLVSAVTIAELHDHDCMGDGCPTCVVLGTAQSMLGATAAPASGEAACISACAFVAFAVMARALLISVETPVSNRVRLII